MAWQGQRSQESMDQSDKDRPKKASPQGRFWLRRDSCVAGSSPSERMRSSLEARRPPMVVVFEITPDRL
jgi:hypothetical protein